MSASYTSNNCYLPLLASAVLALNCIPAAASDLKVATWGGDYEKSQRMAYGKVWEKKFRKKIEWIKYNGGLAEVRAQVKSGQVEWDIVDVFPHDARVGCKEGLFEKLPDDFGPIGRTNEKIDLVVPRPNDCVAPNIIWPWVVFYRSGEFGNSEPRSIADFFDLKRFPGKRALGSFPQASLEMALVADGVQPTDVYKVLDTPNGIERAFSKLNSLGDQVVFWSSGAEPIKLIESGRAAMAVAYNGRVSSAILSDGANYKIVWDGQVLEEEWFAIVKGSKNIQSAIEFLRIATSSTAQAEQARWIPYGPMRRSALDIIAQGEPWFHSGKKVMPHMPDRDSVMKRTIIANPDWWARNGTKLTERYKAWIKGR